MLYNRTNIVNYFTVKSIVTIYDLDLKSLDFKGESHDFWEIVYVEKGKMRLLLDGKETVVAQGEAVFYAPNVHHCNISDNKNDAKVKIVSFICEPEQIDDIKNKIIRPEYEEVQLINRIISEGIEYFENADASNSTEGLRVKDGVSPGKLQSLKNRLEILLIKILEREYDKQHKKPNKDYKMTVAETISKYLADNICSKLTLTEIASYVNLSVSSIKQIFKASYNCGIIEYFLVLKVDKAKELIETTSLNVTQITNYLGFESVHYFSRAFKKRTGMTPSEYRQLIKHK